MSKNTVIFTGFANPKRDLENLNKEHNGIQEALASLVSKGVIKTLWQKNEMELKGYFNAIHEWRNQVAIFHFGGHANSQKLSLQDNTTFFAPLAEELVARNSDSLQLVFLNGCSTQAHVKTLFDLGVKAVIATSADVKDGLAAELAITFYENLAKGDSIKAAFESSARYTKSLQTPVSHRILDQPEDYRGSRFFDDPHATDLPWGLYVSDDTALEYTIIGQDDSAKAEEKEASQGNVGQIIHGDVHNQATGDGVIISGNTQGDINIGRGGKDK
jgi:hypothetical protein